MDLQWYSSFSSSNVLAFLYNPDTSELFVRFKSKLRTYRYANVPRNIYVEWINAPSKGKYHAANIKWKYQYTLL